MFDTMNSQEIYQRYGQEVYLFILKTVKNKHVANDVFQSSFLKVHKNLDQLKARDKARAWIFQISRNEINNYFNRESNLRSNDSPDLEDQSEPYVDICCFDRFIEELPSVYQEVIQLTYLSGKKQEEVADMLDISLANVKARIRRAKALLKERFLACCQYEINAEGKLIGTPNCAKCS